MDNPLGKKVDYPTTVDPKVLYAIPRRQEGQEIQAALLGCDIWNCYELSWCDRNGEPHIGIAQIQIDCQSKFIIESKSLKLFLGGFHKERFESKEQVQRTIEDHLGSIVQSKLLTVHIFPPEDWDLLQTKAPRGICIDQDCKLNVGKNDFFYSNLLRSVCPVTGQPDIGTFEMCYRGPEIDPQKLKEIIISLREHQGFHEAICELLLDQILKAFKCEKLSVLCAFNRRGGIDINPMRFLPGSTPISYQRLQRQ